MKKIFYIIITLFYLTVFSQEKGIYSSTIQEDTGKPLAGVTVRVRGTGEIVTTNFNGEFTVHANVGDVLIISKNGKRISTITLNNSNFYKIEDASEKKLKKRSKSFKKQTKVTVIKMLDSAKFYQKTNPTKSIQFIEIALKNMGSKGSKKQISDAYVILGDTYFYLKQYDLAVSNYETALNFFIRNSIKFKLAKAYTLTDNFDESTEMYNDLLKEKISTYQKIVVYEGLGDNSSKKLDKLDEAIQHYNKGLAIATQNNFAPKISELNSKIGETYHQKGENKQAEDYFKNSINTAKIADVNLRKKTQNSIANYYKEQKQYDKEIALRKKTLEVIENDENDNSDETIFEEEAEITPQKLNLAIGNAYFNKGELKEAIPYLEKSIEKASLVLDLETQKDALQQLSELYRSAGKSNKALEKYQEYAKLVDKIYKQKEQQIKDAINLGKELTNKQNRISSLEKDRELFESRYKFFSTQKELTKEMYRRQQWIIYSLLVGLLLLVFSVFWMYKSNKQKRLANNLLALKSLRTQMNPHFIFNALNSVNNYISQNDERAANRYLTEFSTLMRSVLDYSEQDFIPLSKEIELLQLYLKLEHSRFKDKFDYQLIIDDTLQISEFQIPPMLLQPYVENAVWHGLRYKKEKGTLTIHIQQKNHETVTISIIDDGIGRKKSKELKTENQIKQKSQGMNNIKKRIAILNQMYTDKIDVFIDDLHQDSSGTKVVLTLKKD